MTIFHAQNQVENSYLTIEFFGLQKFTKKTFIAKQTQLTTGVQNWINFSLQYCKSSFFFSDFCRISRLKL